MTKNGSNPQLAHLVQPDIINSMHDGLFLVNTSGKIEMVNEAFLKMTGYEEGELIGKPCTVLKCDACDISRAKGEKQWCQLFLDRRENKKQCHLRRRDGSYMHVLKNASLIYQGEEVVGGVENVTDISELDQRDATIHDLKQLFETDQGFHGMIGTSSIMRKTYALLEKASVSDAPVIIYGESGTGKELAARAIHDVGPRREHPYIQCNCAALNESLLESELFGHIKGAFTGAHRHRVGRFEAAHGGDLFLDEIGDVPLSIQVKLLRVLESKQFERVGDHQPVNVDVRIITATNQDLQSLVCRGSFREDLFYRINVIPVHMPPLRERKEDIPLLVQYFIDDLRTRSNKPISGITGETLERFLTYHWPGNVRELKSALEYGFVVSEGPHITLEQVPRSVFAGEEPKLIREVLPSDRELEKQSLITALREAKGNKSQAARMLGVTRATILNRMRKYGIEMEKKISCP